jgi:hypothetical protein
MEGKSIENRIYQIIIICLLIILVIFLAKGQRQTGRYQGWGNVLLNTETGETYKLESMGSGADEAWVWSYLGKPKKTLNYEEKTEQIMKEIEKGR